jgi:hypothetical protein
VGRGSLRWGSDRGTLGSAEGVPVRSSRGFSVRQVARFCLRAAGAVAGPGVLGTLLIPAAAMIAGFRVATGRSDLADPSCARSIRRALSAVRGETRAVLTGVAWVFRDRFAEPAWQRRIQIPGQQRIQAALGSGSPVVLVTVHTEAMYLLGRFLAAAGFRTAVLVENASHHSRRFGSEPGLKAPPTLINASDLRTAAAFLGAPGVLVIAADAWRGKHVECRSERHGVFISLATGAARLARRQHAICLSAVAIQRRPWRYSVLLGSPIDTQDTPEAATRALGRDLLQAVIPHRVMWAGVLRDAVRPITRDDQVSPMQGVELEGAQA